MVRTNAKDRRHGRGAAADAHRDTVGRPLKVTVIDGPFIESKESVGGFSIIEVPDLEAAIALAKTWPGYGIEIRDVVEQRERAEV